MVTHVYLRSKDDVQFSTIERRLNLQQCCIFVWSPQLSYNLTTLGLKSTLSKYVFYFQNFHNTNFLLPFEFPNNFPTTSCSEIKRNHPTPPKTGMTMENPPFFIRDDGRYIFIHGCIPSNPIHPNLQRFRRRNEVPFQHRGQMIRAAGVASGLQTSEKNVEKPGEVKTGKDGAEPDILKSIEINIQLNPPNVQLSARIGRFLGLNFGRNVTPKRQIQVYIYILHIIYKMYVYIYIYIYLYTYNIYIYVDYIHSYENVDVVAACTSFWESVCSRLVEPRVTNISSVFQ